MTGASTTALVPGPAPAAVPAANPALTIDYSPAVPAANPAQQESAVRALPPGGWARLTVAALARDERPAALAASTTSVYQGGALLVTVSHAAAGTASLLDTVVAPAAAGGALVAYLGIPTNAPVGLTTLAFDGTDLLGDPVHLTLDIRVRETDWTVDYITLPPGVGSDLTPEIIQAEADRLAALFARTTPVAGVPPWRWPVAGSNIRGCEASLWQSPCVSGYFGEQRSFDGGPPTGHHGGTDIAADRGTPVYAPNAGTVTLAEKLAVRGNAIVIDHGGGVHSLYGHLDEILVSEGQQVVPGQLIGRVGTTGLSTGPHLHWEMAVHGILVDGLRWLDGTQGF